MPKCLPVFEKLFHELGLRYHNWLVVIEPESGDYFLGQADLDVLSRARKINIRRHAFLLID